MQRMIDKVPVTGDAGARLATAFIAAVMLVVVATGGANAASCSSSITTCGCTITRPGVYTVSAALSSTQGLTSRNGCIDVAAEEVTLITNGFNITGASTGTGVGIHLLPGTETVFLEAASHGNSNATTIKGWQYGLESEASDVISDDFVYRNNTTGVLLKGENNNNINDFSSRGNSVYGVWIKGSSGNQINCSNSNNNAVAGVYLSCSATGPAGKICDDQTTSNGNFIYDHSSFHQVGTSLQSYGIAVEKGSQRNKNMETFSSGSSVDDLFDGNTNDSNLWRSNTFTTANQSCIQ